MSKQKCNLEFTKLSMQDLGNIPKYAVEDCINVMNKLRNNINIGQPLENKNNKNLQGYYKLYFADRRYRIIYKKVDNSLEIISVKESKKPVARIIAVGKRANEIVYETAYKRIQSENI